MKNGGQLVVEGDADFSYGHGIVAGTGGGVILFTGKTSATLASVTCTAGPLNIRTLDADATVTVTALAGQAAPANLYMNGVRARVDADGVVSPDPTYGSVIAAKGDVVPNTVDKPVSIALNPKGTAANTLAADATQVAILTQASTCEAEVAIGEGQTLTADKVEMDADAAALTVSGLGSLVSTGALWFENDSEAALRVEADLAPGTEARVEKGTGPVVLAGSASEPLVLKQTDGTVVISGEKPITFDHFWVGTNSTQVAPKIVFDGAKDVHLGKKTCTVGKYYGPSNGGSHDGIATMVVTNSLIRTDNLTATGYASAAPAAGFTTYSEYGLQFGDRCWGELYMQAGAVITNRLMIGNAFDQTSGCGGTVYQDGGEVTVLGCKSSMHDGSFIGNRGSHGYYELDAGALNWYGMGMTGGYTSGLFIQNGGTFFATHCFGDVDKTLVTFYSGGANNGRGQIVFRGGTAVFENCTLRCCGASTYSDGGGEIVLDDAADVDVGAESLRRERTTDRRTASTSPRGTMGTSPWRAVRSASVVSANAAIPSRAATG